MFVRMKFRQDVDIDAAPVREFESQLEPDPDLHVFNLRLRPEAIGIDARRRVTARTDCTL